MTEPLIVVPLDGSELSERALPYASAMARATGAHLLLLTVWEEGERALITKLPDLAEDLFKQGEEHYEDYLVGVAKKLQAEGVDAETDVLSGRPVEEILRVAEQRAPHMIVMATHGRSGLSRWRYGSVASRLAREAPVPTMIVGPKVLEDAARGGAIRRILVPLDGSPLAESALRPALELAEALDASLLLAQVVHWTTQAFTSGPGDVAVAEIRRQLTEAAQQYLARAGEGLGTQRPVESKVLYGPPADALIDLAEAEGIDLVVMASHTRGGLARAVLGSVADRLLQGNAPVLLVRPEEVTQHRPRCSRPVLPHVWPRFPLR